MDLSPFPQLDIPRPEHPRPDFTRELTDPPHWLNLNGTWLFEFDTDDTGEKERWYLTNQHHYTQQIVVPYPWQSKLSGINQPKYQGIVWYQRTVSVPVQWVNHRIILKFDAVDWYTKVWVNGNFVGDHQGGYSSFEFDITGFITKNEIGFGTVTITLRVLDKTDPETLTGKQTGWYTPSGGIWQTVYLEPRNEIYIANLKFIPDIDTGRINVEFTVVNNTTLYRITFRLDSVTYSFPSYQQDTVLYTGVNTVNFSFTLPKPILWSPEVPNLYEVKLTLFSSTNTAPIDCIYTYFGMRKIHTAKYGNNEYEYVFLNNNPVYLIGVLDQSFNPEGLYTYPNDEYIKNDLLKTKQFGFNFLRIHIKTEEPRFLYWADKLGVLLMCDLPNFNKYTDLAKQYYEQNLTVSINRDFNHPSIFCWVLFNETWGLEKHSTSEGQNWVKKMFCLTKKLDPTRLVEDVSPCNYDHIISDLNSWHFYINDYTAAKTDIQRVVENTYPGSKFNYIGGNQQTTIPLLNSEYGGIGAGDGDKDISWCFKFLTNELRKHQKICGYIYTELQDIEWEHNGFMDYDRSVKSFGYENQVPGFSYCDLNNPDFLVLDSPPCPQVKPGDVYTVPVYFSHWSDKQVNDCILSWRVTGIDLYGKTFTFPPERKNVVINVFYGVEKVDDIKITVPERQSLLCLTVELNDLNGILIARNYINFNVHSDVSIYREIVNEVIPDLNKRCIYFLRFKPGKFSRSKWSKGYTGYLGSKGEKFCASSTGYVEYQLFLPEPIEPKNIVNFSLIFESSAWSDKDKVEFLSPHTDVNFPQTVVGKEFPTDITITINDREITTLTLPDTPADSTGVLSYVEQYHPGTYGYLTELNLTQDQLNKLDFTDKIIKLKFCVKDNAVHQGGFALYGSRLGRYPVDPTLKIEFTGDVPVPFTSAETQLPVTTNVYATPEPELMRTWLLIGPFDNYDGVGFDTEYPPEKEVSLTTSYLGINSGTEREEIIAAATRVWTKFQAQDKIISLPTTEQYVAYFDFIPIFNPNLGVVCYAVTGIYSETEQIINLRMGSDDGVKVWLNNLLIGEHNVTRGAYFDQDVFTGTLRPGWNKLLVKITQHLGSWGMYCRVTDLQGYPIPNLKYGLAPFF